MQRRALSFAFAIVLTLIISYRPTILFMEFCTAKPVYLNLGPDQ